MNKAEIYLKSKPFVEKFSVAKLWKIRKLSAKEWKKLTLPIQSASHSWDAIYGILEQRIVKKKQLPSEKSEFAVIFAKNSLSGKFSLPKILAPVNYNVANAAKKQKVPSNAFAKKKELRNLKKAVGNGECHICFEKSQKLQLFW